MWVLQRCDTTQCYVIGETKMKKSWWDRLAEGFTGNVSKHGRAERKPKNWRHARKVRRLMAKESRRRNR